MNKQIQAFSMTQQKIKFILSVNDLSSIKWLNYPQTLLLNISKEIQINWLFIKRDVTVTVVPGILFSITALLNYPQITYLNWVYFLISNLIYCWLGITYFCISNQLYSIEEDTLNKPDRPLIQNLLSYRNAQIRSYIVMLLFSLVAWWLGVFEWALLWQGSSIAYNYLGGAKHWLTKNILSGLGIISILGASWQTITPITHVIWTWIAVLGIIFISLISISDFRDIAGDKAIGRITFPLIFGECWSRLLVSTQLLIFPVLIHLLLMMPLGNQLNILFWDISIFIISCILAVRIFIFRDCIADRKTYVLFTCWYCLILTSTIFVLRL